LELRIIKVEAETVITLLDDNMRLVKPVQAFLRYQKLRGMALNTMKAYGRDLKIYWDFLNHCHYAYDEMTVRKLSEFVEYLRNPDCSDSLSLFTTSCRTPQTINHILGTVHCFYKYCGIMSQIDNPILMRDVNRPRDMFKNLLYHARQDNQTKQSVFKVKESKHTVHLVPPSDVETLSKHLHTTRDRLILKILSLTGARISEVLDLQIEEIPYPDSSKQIGTLTDIKSKGCCRTLYLPLFLLEEIDQFILEERSLIETEHSYIFVSLKKERYGQPLTYQAAYGTFHSAMQKAGVFFHFHDLRHTFISTLVESGMDISVVRIIAGHKQIATTQQYTHLSNRYLYESLNKYWSRRSASEGALNEK
jgi:site-specific recombinase XerD